MGLSSVISQRSCRSEKILDDWKKIPSGSSNKLVVLLTAQHLQEWVGDYKIESKLSVQT